MMNKIIVFTLHTHIPFRNKMELGGYRQPDPPLPTYTHLCLLIRYTSDAFTPFSSVARRRKTSEDIVQTTKCIKIKHILTDAEKENTHIQTQISTAKATE